MRADDVTALHALVEACERDLLGYAESDADEIRAVLGRPGLDPVADTVLVTAADGDDLVHAHPADAAYTRPGD